MKSVGHLKCLQVKTGTPAEAKQSTMDQSISLGTLKQHGVKAITSLLKTELHIGWKEKQFKAIELNDNGAKTSTAYWTNQSYKAFIHLVADEFS